MHEFSKAGQSEPSPASLDRYVLEAIVGSGSVGVVYRARDRVLGRVVAIKTIRRELVSRGAEYDAYRKRFYQEAHIFGSLSHPNIVALYDIGETGDGIPYLAMEFVPEASLAKLPRSLSLDQAMWLMAQLASGIDYAHERGVVHRDIKPSNILLGEGEEAKIADFGVAKLLGEQFTRSQTQFGTPGYMSPEQVIGKELTGRTDVFSLGVVAFELLSGRKPFPGKTVHSILHKIVHAEPVVPTNLEALGLVSDRWHDVFKKVLTKEPADRFTNASEFVSELVELFPGSWLGDLTSDGSGAVPAAGFDGSASADTLTLYGATDRRAPRSGEPSDVPTRRSKPR